MYIIPLLQEKQLLSPYFKIKNVMATWLISFDIRLSHMITLLILFVHQGTLNILRLHFSIVFITKGFIVIRTRLYFTFTIILAGLKMTFCFVMTGM